jgi:hypothetical protein
MGTRLQLRPADSLTSEEHEAEITVRMIQALLGICRTLEDRDLMGDKPVRDALRHMHASTSFQTLVRLGVQTTKERF